MRIPSYRISGLFASLLFLPGCSVHPLPEDVSHSSTSQIVRKTRCEARAEIVRQAADPGGTAFRAIDWDNAYIGWDFNFDITENNHNAMSATIKPPITGGSLSLSLAAADDRDREAKRTYRIVEQFKDLKAYAGCSGNALPPNLAYPLTGSVGVDEVVRTFAESGTRHSDVSLKSGLLVDKLTFTTTKSLGVDNTPSISFTSTNPSAAVQATTFSPFDSRKDIHKVTVVVSWDKPDATTFQLLDRRLKFQQRQVQLSAPLAGAGNVIVPYQTRRMPYSILDAQNDALLADGADTRLNVIAELNRLRAIDEERQRQIDGVAGLKELIQQLLN